MAEAWRNLEICKVEDAGTMWVRELPSQMCSKELQQFLEMEKQMNQHFKSKQNSCSQHGSLIKVGNCVVVWYKDSWARGKVQKIPQAKGEKTSVFLLDYGLDHEVDLLAIIPVVEGEWSSVPCQARKISLHGVVPVSFRYAFIDQDMKLALRQCKKWDVSATEYVERLSSMKPQAEFTPIKYSQEGCLYGKVSLILSEETWLPVIPLTSQSKLIHTQNNLMALDLAQLLIDYEFAQQLKEEDMSTSSSDQILPTTRYLNVLPQEISSSVDARKHTKAAGIERNDKTGIGFECESGVSSSEEQHQPTRTSTEEMSALGCYNNNNNNNNDNNSYTEVISPLLGRLSSKRATLPKDKVLSFIRSNPESRFLVSAEKEDLKSSENVSVSCNNNPVRIEEMDPSCLQIVEDNGMKAASSLPECHEHCAGAKDSPRRPEWSNIPSWVSMSLVRAMHHPESTRQKQSTCKYNFQSSQRDHLIVDESNKSSKTITAHHKNPENKKKALNISRDENEHENNSKSKKVSQLTSTAFFMTGDVTKQKNCCTSILDDIYSNLLKQDSCSSLANIVKTSRVLVAGESRIMDEEVMVNKDIMNVTLNSHVFDLLVKKGIMATRLQAYTWPTIIRGCSAVIVGDKSSGKTMGYIVPLLSTILDTYQYVSGRLPIGIGPLMVVVCSSWQSANSAAENVISLLPGDTTLKVMTAWGGCGNEEEISTGKQLLGGCDILVTTAPCLMRCLTGDSTLWGGGSEGAATTTLTRCCHLVVDDADVILENFSLEVKQIITIWGEERKKCTRLDLELQAVLVSSKWTKLLSQLTQVLFPLLDPTVIISTPFEAAIATKVRNHFHVVANEEESLGLVMNFIAASYSQRKNMIFVRNDNVADKLGLMMNNIALYSLVVNTVNKRRLQQLVDEWHLMQNVTMIVSESVEKALLHHDISNAHIIFHTHIGMSLDSFTNRYGFMSQSFGTGIQQKYVNCESYVIVSTLFSENIPKVWSELNRLGGHGAKEMKEHLLLTESEGLENNNDAICCHLKAYGRCFDQSVCNFRHEVYASDTAHYLPKTGKVTVKIIKVLNASRYLVHLIEYQEKPDEQKVDLSNHYHILRSILQQHYADSANHKPLQFAEKGMFCGLEDNGVWNRAQVNSVNYSKATCLLNVFLIDEGKEMTVQLDHTLVLPAHLAVIPQLTIEVFLCCIQPWDQDREWTPQACNFVKEIFVRSKESKFVGTIALALGYTLWLKPLVELSKIGTAYAPKKSLRGQLIVERFGTDNCSHLENLEEVCSAAGVSLREDMCNQGWLEAHDEVLHKISTNDDNKNLSNDALTNGEKETDEIRSKKKEACKNNLHHLRDDSANMSPVIDASLPPQHDTQTDHLLSISPGKNDSNLSLSHEHLPLDTEVRVQVTELVSHKEFYVVREDKLTELEILEEEINYLHDYLDSCEEERKSGDKTMSWKPSPGSPCIAKFTDNNYFRGLVKAGSIDGSVIVHFVDHGETISVPECQIHACSDVWVEYMPGQAIRCTLAHITIPSHLSQAATHTMMDLIDTSTSWTVKAVESKDDDGLLYVVELTSDAEDSPLEMWRQLVYEGLALMDTETVLDGACESAELFNVSNIDDQEVAEFLLGISAIKPYEDEQSKTTVNLETNTTALKIEQMEAGASSGSRLSEANHGSDRLQQHSSLISLCREKESKDVSSVGKDERETAIWKSGDSVTNVDTKDTEKKQCEKEKPYNCQEAEVKKSLNFEKKEDAKRIVTSENQAFDMKRLGMPSLCAVDQVTRKLAPETSWSQKENTININVHLVGVEKYKCRVTSTHLLFMSVLGDKFYAVDEELCHEVTANSTVVTVLGLSVSITLKKVTKGQWINLFKERTHRPWLKTQYQNLSSGEDSSETEDYDYDVWRGVNNNELPIGGLPAGISDTDETSGSEASDELL